MCEKYPNFDKILSLAKETNGIYKIPFINVCNLLGVLPLDMI